MRGQLEGVPSPHPLADTLPSMLREDAFARSLCGGFDEVLSPVLLTLDSFAAYLDLATAPADLLPWLAQWVGMAADHGQDPDLLRQQLRASREQHASRGTRRGIELAVRAAYGVAVQVEENGASGWSSEPGRPLPGDPEPSLRVTVRVARADQVDPDALDAFVASVKPAHVPHETSVQVG
ncbi:MAG TPA: phage tail protein [Friedmanniella sp.]